MQELRGTDAYLLFSTSVSKTLKNFHYDVKVKKVSFIEGKIILTIKKISDFASTFLWKEGILRKGESSISGFHVPDY